MCAVTHQGTFPSCNIFSCHFAANHVIVPSSWTTRMHLLHFDSNPSQWKAKIYIRKHWKPVECSRMIIPVPRRSCVGKKPHFHKLSRWTGIFKVKTKSCPNICDDLTPLLKSLRENSSKTYHVDKKKTCFPASKEWLFFNLFTWVYISIL